jgi:transcriptional regulator with GAF, ATPase, and Fis domain
VITPAHPSGRLLVDLSTRFTGLPVDEVDGEIERALHLLVDWLDTDRSTFFLIEPDGQLVQTHTWAREGLPPVSPASMAGTRWYKGTLASGQAIALARLPDDLPEQADGERAYVRASGLRSVLAVPVALGGRFVCALSTGAFREYRAWDEETVDRVRVVAQIFANAVHRKRTELQLRSQLDEIRALRDRLEAENVYLREEIRGGDFADVVGRSPALRRVLERIAQVAPTSSTVLLLGETGTGKELLAQAIHERSPRRAKPFIKVNCSALPASLIETELLGHEKGAFTGAIAAHPGHPGRELRDSPRHGHRSEGGDEQRHGPPSWRERHRERGLCERHSPLEREERQSVHHRQLRGPLRAPAGE